MAADPQTEAHDLSAPTLQDTQLVTTVAQHFAVEKPSANVIDTIQASSHLPLDYNPFYSPPQRQDAFAELENLNPLGSGSAQDAYGNLKAVHL